MITPQPADAQHEPTEPLPAPTGDATQARPRRRADKHTVRQRVSTCVEMILCGKTFRQIFDHAREQGWHVRKSQMKKYTRAAHQQIEKASAEERHNLKAFHFARCGMLYRRALEQGDIRAALRCLDSQAKLLGLFDPEPRQQQTAQERQAAAANAVDEAIKALQQALGERKAKEAAKEAEASAGPAGEPLAGEK